MHPPYLSPAAATEVAVGLALVLQLYKRFKTLDLDMLNKLKG